ncbi:uncharacterized protein FOMMEDRAFT_156751 [Fomitiporia mediterranea MF3/22]|uniref:uncharacterized protein n=1 Tax=Fomitiporia mediterranea (strain MF3/22) TaxID=694068 RepID=UPI00044085B1|nr:uncharacterized protein FOMMEDRAFT_156751 [Fomitiporia mediterranea MF3/22]EJD03352.1 hypothetical protein FOMMEDRAFT_156751 [Fomitiporia mediterranea MF3/22]
MQCTHTNTSSPAAQISSFTAPDLNLGAPLTLAVCVHLLNIKQQECAFIFFLRECYLKKNKAEAVAAAAAQGDAVAQYNYAQ